MSPAACAFLQVWYTLFPAYIVWLAVLSHHHSPSFQRCRYAAMSPPVSTTAWNAASSASHLRQRVSGKQTRQGQTGPSG